MEELPDGKKNMKQRKRYLLTVLAVLCAAGAAAAGWGLYQELKLRADAENVYAGIRKMAFREEADSALGAAAQTGAKDTGGQSDHGLPDRGEPDWETLRAWNPDICGWIYCPGTAIDYPVVQGRDNEWYLERTTDQNKSAIGSIFLESGNRPDFSDDVSVIYGHHIRGGKMFTPLSGYKEQKYYQEHPRMYLYTPEQVYAVELFAGEILSGSTGSFPLRFADGDERQEWIARLWDRGGFQGAGLPGEERILALCTCTYEYQDARYAVYGILEKLNIDKTEEEENTG